MLHNMSFLLVFLLEYKTKAILEEICFFLKCILDSKEYRNYIFMNSSME